MQSNLPLESTPRRLSLRRRVILSHGAAAAILLLPSAVLAQTVTNWGGGTSTAWGTAGNWSNDVPNSPTEVATFNAATTNDPATYSSFLFIGGFNLTGGESRVLTFTSGLNLFQYGVDNSSEFDLTITGTGINVTLTEAQTWSVTNTGDTTFSKGPINNGNRLLTLEATSSGTGEITSVIFGEGGISKIGSGTWTLSGNSSYTGTTSITGGTLVINGNQQSASGNVTLSNSGTRLAGTGTVGGDHTTFNSGTIHAPGAVGAVGLQTFFLSNASSADITYSSGSIFEWQIDRTKTQTRGIGYDALNLEGASSGSGAIFRIVIGDSAFNDTFWSVNRTWADIFTATDGTTPKANWANTFSGGFQFYDTSGTNLGTPSASLGAFSMSGNTLTWTAGSGPFIPEPTSALAVFLILGGLMRRRR